MGSFAVGASLWKIDKRIRDIFVVDLLVAVDALLGPLVLLHDVSKMEAKETDFNKGDKEGHFMSNII